MSTVAIAVIAIDSLGGLKVGLGLRRLPETVSRRALLYHRNSCYGLRSAIRAKSGVWLRYNSRDTTQYMSPVHYRLVVLLDVAKLKHASAVALSGSDSLLQLLRHCRVCREVPAALLVNRCKALADEVDVDGRVRVLCDRRIARVNQAEVEELALLLVDVRDELAAFAQGAEAIHRLFVILAVRRHELYEAAWGEKEP